MISFTLPGTLKPKERPRSGKGNFYTPRATQKQEAEIGWLAKAAMNGHAILTGPVSMEIEIMLCPPKSWSEERCATEHYATNKSDLDNQIKTICDALNSIVVVSQFEFFICSAAPPIFGVRQRTRYAALCGLTSCHFLGPFGADGWHL